MFTAPKLTPVFCLHQTIILSIFLLVANVAFAYSGGNGTLGNPYQIADVNDLLQLANDPNDYYKCFILTADIDLAGQVFSEAVIAKQVYSPPFYTFTGTFDGAGHKISNLTIVASYPYTGYLGLFGDIGSETGGGGGTIKNLGLENVSIISGDYSVLSEGLLEVTTREQLVTVTR